MLNRNKTKFDSSEFFVIRKKVFSYLKGLNDNYDLIFADPPYDKLDYSLLVNMCIEKLSKNGKLIVEMSNNKFSFKDSIERKYGDTKIVIYNQK